MSEHSRVPQFGERQEEWLYPARQSVYGLACDAGDRVFVVSTRGKLVLPGGGIDEGETPQEALQRETLEETGWHAMVGDELCSAQQYVVSRGKARSYNKHGRFYRIKLLSCTGPPLETDHKAFWLSIGEAARGLHHEFHRWAVGHLNTLSR